MDSQIYSPNSLTQLILLLCLQSQTSGLKLMIFALSLKEEEKEVSFLFSFYKQSVEFYDKLQLKGATL